METLDVIAVDTNVLARLLVSDHAAQSKASQTLFATEEIFLPDTVLLETEWVLRAVFDRSRQEVCNAFRQICGLPNVTLSDARLFAQVVDWHDGGLDFADAFHLALSIDQEAFKTFDRDFVKLAKRLSVPHVERL